MPGDKEHRQIKLTLARSSALFFEMCLSEFWGGIFVCECFHSCLKLKKKKLN